MPPVMTEIPAAAWLQTAFTVAGILAAVVASHQKIVAGMSRLDERIREHSVAVAARLEHVERELDEHTAQLHKHALGLDRVEQALTTGPMPLCVIQDRVGKLEGEVDRLRTFRHDLENEKHSAQLRADLAQRKPARAPRRLSQATE